MNKPVFDTDLTGKQINVGDVLGTSAPNNAETENAQAKPIPPDVEEVRRAPLPDFDDDANRAHEASPAAEHGSHVATEQTRRASSVPAHEPVSLPVSDMNDPERNAAPVVLNVSDFSMASDSSAQAMGASSGQDAYSFSSGPVAESQAAAGDPQQSAYKAFQITLDDTKGDTYSLFGVSLPAGYDIWSVDGRGGNDSIIGSGALDSLVGGVGDDTLVGGVGQDTLTGGSGTDWLDYTTEGQLYGYASPITGVLVNFSSKDTAMGKDGVMVVRGTIVDTQGSVDIPAGIEGVIGSDLNDEMRADGTVNNVQFKGGKGKDLLFGSDAAAGDTLDGGEHADTIYGGNGTDRIYASDGIASDGAIDELHGGQDNDTIVGGAEDYLWGDEGSNDLTGGHVTYTDSSAVSIMLSGNGKGEVFHSGWMDTVHGAFWYRTGSGADTIKAGTWGVEFYGGDGQDSMIGGAGSDKFYGEGGFDMFYGSGGNDTLDSGADEGGQVDYGAFTGSVVVDLKNRTAAKPGSVSDVLIGVWNVIGSQVNDTLTGDDRVGGNWLSGNTGNDRIFGLAGNDLLNGDAGDDFIDGGTGNDQIYGGLGSDEILGGNDNDTIYADDTNDTIGGMDTIDGGQGSDIIYGGANNDSILGGTENDTLFGGTGNDVIKGGLGADYMEGNAGNDEYWIDDVNDVVFEIGGTAEGIDTINTPFSIDLSTLSLENASLLGTGDVFAKGNASSNRLVGNDGKNILIGYEGNDTLEGGKGDDNLDGGADNDTLDGGAGADTLLGGAGIDLLVGGDGKDSLDGGAGADTMYGNDGDDRYIINDLNDRAFEDKLGLSGGDDTVVIKVAHYDARKIDWTKIEHVEIDTAAGGSLNWAPTDPVVVNTQTYTLSINEETKGAVAQVNSTDKDTDMGPIRYELENDFGGTFKIDAVTGIISVEQPIDFELDQRLTSTSDREVKTITLRVRAKENSTDPAALQSDWSTVTISIKNINDKPNAPTIDTTLPVNSVIPEAKSPGNLIAQMQATDPDNAGGPIQTVTIKLVDNLGGRFAIDSTNKIILGMTPINFEAEAAQDAYISAYDPQTGRRYYDLKVYAEDNLGKQSDLTTVRVWVTDVNEKATLGLVEVLPYVKVGSTGLTDVIVDASFNDPDIHTAANRNNKFAFVVNGERKLEDGKFEINEIDGTVTLNALLTAEDAAAGKKTVQVVVYDSSDPDNQALWDIKSYDIVIKSAPWDVHVGSGGTTALLNEHPGPASVAIVSASDDVHPLQLSYSLADPSGHFKINSATGEIYVDNDSGLDFESAQGNSYKVMVTVKDGDQFETTQEITIQLRDVNEAPTAVLVHEPVATVRVGDPSDTVIVDADAVDPDTLNPEFQVNVFKFLRADGSLSVTSDDGFFIIDATGKVKLVADVTAAQLNSSHSFTIVTHTAGDEAHYVASQTYTVVVQGAGVPGDIALTGLPIAENGAAQVAGTLTASDPDSAITGFTLVDADAPFQIEQQGGNWVLVATGGLNYEDAPHHDTATGERWYEVTVTAQSGSQSSDPKVVRVYVTDVNEAPDLSTSNATVSIGADAETGDILATFSVADPDFNEQFVYKITGVPASMEGAFAVDAVNKTIYVADKSKLVDAGNVGFVLTLEVKDKNGAPVALSDSQAFTVTITAANEPPNAPTGGNASVLENAESTAVLVQLTGSADPEGGGVLYSLLDDPSGHFLVSDTGAVTLKPNVTLDYEALDLIPDPNIPGGKYYLLKVVAQDLDGNASDPTEVRIYVTNENEGPDQINLLGGTISENIGKNTLVGDLEIHDPEGNGIADVQVESNSHFKVQKDADNVWRIYVDGVINFEDIPLENRSPDGQTGWYDLTVKARDDLGEWGPEQTIRIYVQNQDPENQAPVISVNGQTNWNIKDTDTVAPFKHLSFSDAEEGETGTLYVQILFDYSKGDMILPLAGRFPNVTIYQRPDDPQSPEFSYGTLVIGGVRADIEAFIYAVSFDPKNLGPDHTGEVASTDFTVQLVDSGTPNGMSAYATEHVWVNAQTSGDTSNDPAPVITVGKKVWDTTDRAVQTVKPFSEVTLTDNNSTLTLKISFHKDDGTLNVPAGTQEDYDPATGRITYTFPVANAEALTALLHSLEFDAKDRDAPGPAIETLFTISLDDGHHAFPVTNEQVKVVTTVTGPDANTAPILVIDPETVTTDATANGLAVFPFRGVDIADAENDDLTLTISFAVGVGTLGGTGNVTGESDGVTITYRFENLKADALDLLLHQLTFDPLIPGDTPITITVTDNQAGHVPVSDTVTVHTTPGGDGETNAAPTIDILAGTETTDATANGLAVFPFRGVDIEDTDNDMLTLTISFEADDGLLSGDDLPASTVVGGIRTYVLTGRADELDAFLHGLSFNPTDGSENTTPFKITVQDAKHLPVEKTVTVHTSPGGDGETNAAPTISIATGTETTDAKANGLDVFPFRGVDIEDTDNDILTLTISFEADDGLLSGDGLPNTSTVVGGIRTYVLSGRADMLDNILRGLRFNPTDGVENTTPFKITVQDAKHLPVEKTVTVHTSADGDDETNAQPTITIADDSTDAKDNGPAVKPFYAVNLSDAEDDDLTLTISFIDSHGTLVAPNGYLGTLSGDMRTFVFTGKADDLDDLLHDLTFDPNPIPDTEAQLTTTFDIVVQDSKNPAVSDTVNVVTTNGNGTEQGSGNDPLAIVLAPNFVAERLPNWEIGVLETIDPDVGDTFTYKIMVGGVEADTDGRFAIVSNGANVSLKTVGELDWESTDPLLKTDYYGKYYEVTIRSTDSYGRSLTKTLNVYVTDTADDPSDQTPTIGGTNIPPVPVEDDKIVSPFGTVTFMDPDSAEITVTIALDSPSEGKLVGYTIGSYNELTGVYTVKGSVTDVQIAVQNLKFHAASRPDDPAGTLLTTNFSITVSDGNSSTRDTNIWVESTAVDGDGGNSPPSAPSLDQVYVFEADGSGTLIGNLGASDANGDPLEYWLVNALGERVKDDGRFKIVNNELQVSNPLMLDAEGSPFHDIRLVATDGNGGVSEVAFHQISVLDWIGETIDGDAGANVLLGYLGNDNLSGHDGSDILSGGIGRDVLSGGEGADVFVFDTDAAANNTDTIVDFKVSDGDKIHLKWDIFRLGSANVGQTLSEAQFHLGTPASVTSGSTRIIYEKAGNVARLWYDGDGSGTRFSAKLIATFSTEKPTLGITDFLIIA